MSHKRARTHSSEREPGGKRSRDDDENALTACSIVPMVEPMPEAEPQLDQRLFTTTEPEVDGSVSFAPGISITPEPQPDQRLFVVSEPQLHQSVFVVSEPQAEQSVFSTPCEFLEIPLEPAPSEPEVPQPTPNVLEAILNALLLDDNDREVEVEDNEQFDGNPGRPGNGREPLYPGAPLTLHESFVSILSLALTHKLSGVCLKAILDLISLHLHPVNNFRTSLEFFKKYFSYLQGPSSFDNFCSVCYKKLDKNSPCDTCSNSKVCYLVKIPLEHQLQTLMARHGFFSKLNFHQESATDQLRDVYDGKVFKQFKERVRPAENECIITGQVYTDGGALYTSSKVSTWPIFVSINELPYAQRFKPENMLVPAIWCGPVKPLGNILFNAIYPDMLKLSTGISCNITGIGSKIIKGYLLTGTGDTPARSLMMNMVNFNGESSCQRCEQPGELREDAVCVRIFPFKPSEMLPRTSLKMIEYGKFGNTENAFKGVKGPTMLTKLMPDLIRGMAADPMHQIYGGVGRKLIKLLTTTKKKDSGTWSISKHYATLDQRLLSIKPPAHTVRLTRSLDDLAYMKMSELKSLLLDYLLPLVDDILPSNYAKHLASLVAAIQLLSADEVSKESRDVARVLLNKFIAQFPDFYHRRYLTINFHLLLHLADICEDLGPTWCFTCFPLENLMGIILSLVHGTRWAEKQIATSVQTVLSLPDLIQNLKESKAKIFCSKLLNHKRHVNGVLVNECMIVGSSEILEEAPSPIAGELSGIDYKKAAKFHCLQKGKFFYVALSSNLSVNRDSSVALYISDDKSKEVGIVHYFLRLYHCECNNVCMCNTSLFAVIQKLDEAGKFATLVPNIFVPNTKKYIVSNKFVLITSQNLEGVCCRMDFSNKLYVSKPCNSREKE